MQFRANSKDNLDARCNIINLGIRVWSGSLPSLSLEGVRRRRGGGFLKNDGNEWIYQFHSKDLRFNDVLKSGILGTKDPAI